MEARVRENGKVIERVSGIEKESLFTERESWLLSSSTDASSN